MTDTITTPSSMHMLKKIALFIIALGVSFYSIHTAYSFVQSLPWIASFTENKPQSTLTPNNDMKEFVALHQSGGLSLLIEEGSGSNLSRTGSSLSSSIRRTFSPVYAQFTDAVLANGERSLLFFADVSPGSSTSSSVLRDLYYASETPRISTYRIDYGARADVAESYGVTAGNTFIVIDGSGMVLSITNNPDTKDIAILVQ